MEIKTWKELSRRRRPRFRSQRQHGRSSSHSPLQSPVEDVSEQVEDFYKERIVSEHINDKMGVMPTMSASTKKYNTVSRQKKKSGRGGLDWRKNGFWATIILILIASAVLIFGALRFAGPGAGSQDIELTVSGPTQVALGEEATWTIHYKNAGRVALRTAELSVRYPEGLKLIRLQPEASNSLNTSWSLGEIPAGSEGDIFIDAQLFGDEGKQVAFSVELLYQPANFSSDFAKQAVYEISLGSSKLQLEVSSPESTLPDVTHDYSVKIKNISGGELGDVTVRLITDPYFTMSDPEPETPSIAEAGGQKTYSWPHRDWQANQEINFSFVGKYSAEAKGIANMTLELVTGEGDAAKILQEKIIKIPILGEELLLTMRLNDQDNISVVVPGSDLDYSITLQNTSGQDLGDIEVSLKVNPNLIDWSSLQAPVQPRVSEDGYVTLNHETYEALAVLEKGKELNFHIRMRLRTGLSGDGKLKSYATAVVKKVGGESREDISFSTPVLTVDVGAGLKLHSISEYRDDEGIPVGSGPVPPQVGETTTYRLRWDLSTDQSEAGSIIATASLPAGVTWVGNQSVSQGVFGYSPATRQVRWELENLDSAGEQSAKFFVSITPQVEDSGTVLPLLSSVNVTASVNGQSVTITAPAVDTDLSGALYESGQGRVVE